jgi:hypothetical protein
MTLLPDPARRAGYAASPQRVFERVLGRAAARVMISAMLPG